MQVIHKIAWLHCRMRSGYIEMLYRRPQLLLRSYRCTSYQKQGFFHCLSSRALLQYKPNISQLTPPPSDTFQKARGTAGLSNDKSETEIAMASDEQKQKVEPPATSYLLPPTSESKRLKKEKPKEGWTPEEEFKNQRKTGKKQYVASARDADTPKPPAPSAPELCCMSGCGTCVWMVYADELMQYYRQHNKQQDKAAVRADIKRLLKDDPAMCEYILMEINSRIKDHPEVADVPAAEQQPKASNPAEPSKN